ncbi:MAG: response regulator [Candidatus Omnitrophota bacterium]
MPGEMKDEERSSVPLNLLLVEDNETDIKIAQRAFAKSELKTNVYIAHDGEEALQFIRNEGKYKDKKLYPRPGIILLDIKMPKKDGFQVLKELKSDPQYDFIPVIMLTSSKDEEDIVKSYRSGAASFIQKPISYDNFIKVVDNFNYYWHIINRLPNPELGGGSRESD